MKDKLILFEFLLCPAFTFLVNKDVLLALSSGLKSRGEIEFQAVKFGIDLLHVFFYLISFNAFKFYML